VRILILAPQWPDPPRQGAAIRNREIALHLATRHTVTLLTFAPDGGDPQMEPLRDACSHVEVLPAQRRTSKQRLRTLFTSSRPDMAWRLFSLQMLARVQQLHSEETFDAVHVEGIEMAPYAFALLQGDVPHPTVTYDAHNAEYLLQRRAFTTDLREPRRLPQALYSLVQWLRLRRYERDLCLRCKHLIAVSPADMRALSALHPRIGERTLLLPNGVDPEFWAPEAVEPAPEVEEPALVFDGSMSFRPNVDAVRWMAVEVWPFVRQERPDARFYIVGRDPAPSVRALDTIEGVHVTGAVADTRPWVRAATVYVVPMRMGGGVRLKVLQAMSMSRAVVSTPMGAEGIDAASGREMLLAADAPGFARSVLTLLGDPERRKELGRAARARAAERYAWNNLLPALDSVYPSG
jgi:polysaccharide biosynthesis protein PslH